MRWPGARRLLLSAGLGIAGVSSLTAQEGPRLEDVTAVSGVRFLHDPGDLSRFPLPAIMGSGAALFDADGDGDLDIYLIQAGPLPEDRDRIPAAEIPGNRLFLQQPNGGFRDDAGARGLFDRGYGTGVAVGDVNGDGGADVFVANYGQDALFFGGGGSFLRMDSAVFGERWSSSAALCDYDGDTDLDLYVGGYLVDDPDRDCVSASGEPDFCSPQSLVYERDSLFRNRGDGTFEDVTGEAGILAERRPALGVLCHDFTGDGRPDFYVANDGEPNLLWEQAEDGTFADAALFLGVALNAQGRSEASMGVLLGDVDEDADLDLFMTHLRAQTNTLYRNQGGGYLDDTPALGLALPSLPWTGFGTRFLDVEMDGDLDLLLVNGAVAREGGTPAAGGLDAYAEPAQAFLGDGSGRFEEAAIEGFTDVRSVGRGLVTGDWDRDGDLDLVVTAVGGPARLLENRSSREGGFLIVEPREFSRASPGAVVTLELGDRSLVRALNPEAGYLTSSEPVAHFGIPEGAEVTGLSVRWPDGAEERFEPPEPGTRVAASRTVPPRAR
ncbi:MAG: CRTAC1 family protein [Acidobacteria bacterium]|nr:CRTAC1 family protein [Acidobacteriota bacterium]MYH22226.1 CRTAC1 family protein [Acidobacteriota bacterium]MYK79446.1 CRTAC1 family protein [Acidobacteriota bacterium]